MTVVIVSPASDTAESVLDAVALSVQAAAVRGVPTPARIPPDRASVDAALNGSSLFYFGHAGRHRLGSAAPLVDTHNVAHCQHQVILAMACSSLSGLGRTAVAVGVRAYLGFTRPVVVPLTGGPGSLGPWATAGSVLLGGGDVEQAVNDTRDDFEADAERMIAEAGPATYVQAVLDGCVQAGVGIAFDCRGDTTATI